VRQLKELIELQMKFLEKQLGRLLTELKRKLKRKD